MRALPVEFHGEHTYGVEDDMLHGAFATGVAQDNGLTFTHAVGAIALGDARGGNAVMTTTAADDEYLSILTTNEIFEFVMGKPIRFRTVLTPGLTAELPEELNIFTGCMEDMDTATEFQNTGAGMRALCGDIFGFFTPSSDSVVFAATNMYWHCVTGHNDIEQYDAMNAANPNNISGLPFRVFDAVTGDGIERELIAEWRPLNVVPGVGGAVPTIIDAEVNYWIDGHHVCKHRMNGLVYFITIATTQEMNYGVVITNITDICVCNVDYVKCEQVK